MSVKTLLSIFEDQNGHGEVRKQGLNQVFKASKHQSGPIISTRQITSSSGVEENPPPLPARPSISSYNQEESLQRAELKRPPVPSKSKLARTRAAEARVGENFGRINLIDVEEDEISNPNLQIAKLRTIRVEEVDPEPDALNLNAKENSPLTTSQIPSPVHGVSGIFRIVSENTKATMQNLQAVAPKTFQHLAGGTQAALKRSQASIKTIINGIPVPKEFAQTKEDIADLTKLKLGKPDICSRCDSISLSACFSSQSNDVPAYIPWSTPLTRLILHSNWCRFCKLILSMLCRREHDPCLLPEVRDCIEPDWLRGASLQQWIDEEWIHEDKYWPFGRSQYRYEGSTQVLGPLKEQIEGVSKLLTPWALQIATRSAKGGRFQAKRDGRNNSRPTYRQGYLRGKAEATRYPISCIVLITVSTIRGDIPGLLWVDLIGRSNAPGSEEKVLSHFMLRAVHNSLSLNFTPGASLSYGHVIDRKWIEISIGKLWLAECETRHGTKCSKHGWDVAMRKPAFLRLLDVHNLCIVKADNPETSRYVALSYVWGETEMLKLLNENLNAFSSPRGLERFLPELPRTVLDAMEVVTELGEQYLWVDALCILQEQNSKEAEGQIEMMDAVYGSALLTIVAAGGDNADVGLKGIRRQHFKKAGKPGVPRELPQLSATMYKGIEVVAPLVTSQNLEQSTWNSRAWTFQERLLSRRLLSFADEEVVWYCPCMTAREDMSSQDTGRRAPMLYRLNLKPQYLGVGSNSYYRDGSFEITRHESTHVVRSGAFAEYANMIAQYSSRKMKYDSDAISALSGLLRIFSSCFQSECSFGLPNSLLDVALLWRPTEPLLKRDGPKRDGKFPTWSWAGWKGRVAYDKSISVRRDDSGRMMEVEGVRSLLRYFIPCTDLRSFFPLNGTGRGLPWPKENLPREWEEYPPLDGCRSIGELNKTPKLDDLDDRVRPHLSQKLLLFWTSASSAFKIGTLPLQRVDKVWGSPTPPKRSSVLDYSSEPVGNILFDEIDLPLLKPGLHEFIVMSEGQSSLQDIEIVRGEYPYYTVMLIEIDPLTAISRRLGIGRISKGAWRLTKPLLKLVYLM